MTVLNHLIHHRALARLAARAGVRVAGWDAIVLTAGSEEQAALYQRQLAGLCERGLVAPGVVLLAVPDRGAARIGSGGATFEALRVLAERQVDGWGADGWRDKRVLLVHAGGHAKRTPWANVLGKPFVPLPLHADPDRDCPLLIDHIVASAAPLARDLAAAGDGGVVVLTGDVLALWDGDLGWRPGREAVVLSKAVPLDAAGRHGVVVGDDDGWAVDLLQKPTPEELIAAGGLVDGGAALLDTGLFAFRGAAWAALWRLATAAEDPVAELVATGAECSLYEDLAGALVPGRHDWVRQRPLGERLVAALGGCRLALHRCDALGFVHLGTTAEYLAHLARGWDGQLQRRLLVGGCEGVDDRAVVLVSRLRPGASVGPESVVVGSRLGARARIGGRCLLLGVDADEGSLQLSDHRCLWQVPVLGNGGRVVTCVCGVDDDPKQGVDEGSMAGQAWEHWLAGHGITAEELWPDGTPRDLWHARLHPLLPARQGLGIAAWLAAAAPGAGRWAERWRAAPRLALAEIHARADTAALQQRFVALRGERALQAITDSVAGGLHRDLASLAGLVAASAGQRLSELADALPVPPEPEAEGIPASRLAQARHDLLAASGRETEAAEAAAEAMRAVRAAVDDHLAVAVAEPVTALPPGAAASVALPARFDIAGGWSDTPPYCFERPARVLNLAVELDGERSLLARVTALDEAVVRIHSRESAETVELQAADLEQAADLRDRFVLAKQAVQVTGYAAPGQIHQGVAIETHSRVPRGSGLGASSVLAAALVQALQRLAGRPDDAASVADLVLALEQRMGSGGGWQDQVGGLWPGAKVVSTVPRIPLRLQVEQVPLLPAVRQELEARLVLLFTGQERLARNVLQIVVGRYLRRDRAVVDGIHELVELADAGRQALACGDLDGLGRIMAEAWQRHQQLDPHCSNPGVDTLMAGIEDYGCGWKLAGAGGGGFAGIMAKDTTAAERIRQTLARRGGAVRVWDWRLCRAQGI